MSAAISKARLKPGSKLKKPGFIRPRTGRSWPGVRIARPFAGTLLDARLDPDCGIDGVLRPRFLHPCAVVAQSGEDGVDDMWRVTPRRYRNQGRDRKSTRLNSSHVQTS